MFENDLILKNPDISNSEKDYIDLLKGFPYRPTLFLGLGGTGSQAVSKVKHLFEKLYGGRATVGMDANVGTLPSMYAFRAFDTNIGERPMNLYEDREWISIGVEDLAGFYEGRATSEDFRDWVLQAFPMGNLTAGAGGLRNLGRLALLANLNKVRRGIETAKEQITTTAMQMENTKPVVYIFCSLSGGTGSGTLFDTCFLLRYLFPKVEIAGFIGVMDGLPTMTPDQRRQLMVNTYSGLKELNAFMDRSATGVEFGAIKTLSFDIPVKITEPIDDCYLVSPIKSDGTRSLTTHDHITSFMARMAFMMSAYSFRSESKTTPDYAGVMINHAAGRFNKPKGVNARYLVPGMAQIHFPIETVANMFVLRAGIDYLRHQKGGDPEAGLPHAKDFCSLNGLSWKTLRDKLRLDPKSNWQRPFVPMVYEDILMPLFEDSNARYENREAILAHGRAMPDDRARQVFERLKINIDRLYDEVWRGLENKAASLLVQNQTRGQGSLDFLEDTRSILADELDILNEDTEKRLRPQVVDVTKSWQQQQVLIEDVCTDEGALDRLMDNFKSRKVANAYIDFLNYAEDISVSLAYNKLCFDLLKRLIEALDEKVIKLSGLLNNFLPASIKCLEERHRKLATKLYRETEGTDDSVENVCSFIVMTQEWRESFYANSIGLAPDSVLRSMQDAGWHPWQLLDIRLGDKDSPGMAIAQEIIDQVKPLTDHVRNMSNVDILESSREFRGKKPEEIIGSLYDRLLLPQMQLSAMANLLDVEVNAVPFCGGITKEIKDKLEATPRFQGTKFHISDNLENRRINFFTANLPIGMAGCDLIRDRLFDEYQTWCEEVELLYKKDKVRGEMEVRKFQCYPGSFKWPNPTTFTQDIEEEKLLFAKALAISTMIPVGEDDLERLMVVSKSPKEKSYGLFQVGKSQYWLMPFFPPNSRSSIPGKPIRLGTNVYEAYLTFREKTEYKDIARSWIHWFEENCYSMYKSGDIDALRESFCMLIDERKGKTVIMKQIDFYDEIKECVSSDYSWNIG